MDSKDLNYGNTGSGNASPATNSGGGSPSPTTPVTAGAATGASTNKLPEIKPKSEIEPVKITKPYRLTDREIKEFYGTLLVMQMIKRKQRIFIVPDGSANRSALENVIGDLYMASGGNLLDIEEDKIKGGHYYVVSKTGLELPKKIKQAQYEMNTQFDAYRWVDINAETLEGRFALARYRQCLFDNEGKAVDGEIANAAWEKVITEPQWRDHRLFVALKKGISPARVVFLTMLADKFFDKFDFLTLGIEAFTGEVWTEMLEQINNNIWPSDYIGMDFGGTPIDEELLDFAFKIIATQGAEAYIAYQKANADYNGEIDAFNRANEESKRLLAQQEAEERKSFYDAGDGETAVTTTTTTTTEVVEEEDDFYEPPLAVQLAVATTYALNPFYCSPVWYDPWCPVYGPTVIVI